MSVVASTEAGPRDASIISLVGAAHCASHVMQLSLPPLFPILHDAFGVGFTELGLIITLFYASSGLGQMLAGVLVDRYGAQRLLVGGLVLLSAATGLAGLVGAYWMLLPLAVLGGLGNSVFHPADLSILSHRVSEGRLGRAYAVHGISGSLGYATAPLLVTLIAGFANWRVALLAIGIAGLVIAALVHLSRSLLAYRPAEAPRGAAQRRGGYLGIIGTPLVLMAFAYFAMTAFAGSGMQTFSITALVTGYDLTQHAATLALTAYLCAVALGMVAGGFLADRTQRHHRVAMTGIAIAAVTMFALSSFAGVVAITPLLTFLAGFANGVTGPSRDVLIRRAAAGIGTGSVFGFVYSGFDLGSSTAPLLFGFLVDNQAPHAVFLAIACAFALAVPTVMQVQHRVAARARQHAGAD